jgi:hypothetical protein
MDINGEYAVSHGPAEAEDGQLDTAVMTGAS